MSIDQEPKMFNVAGKYGLIIAFASVIAALLMFVVGMEQSPIGQYLGYFITVAGLVFGIREYRDQELGGGIRFGQIIKFGVLTCALAGLVMGAYMYVYVKFINPEFIKQALLLAEEAMYEQGQPEEVIEQGMTYTRMFFQPGFLIIASVLGQIFIGLIFSGIIGLFMQKQQPNNFNNEDDFNQAA